MGFLGDVIYGWPLISWLTRIFRFNRWSFNRLGTPHYKNFVVDLEKLIKGQNYQICWHHQLIHSWFQLIIRDTFLSGIIWDKVFKNGPSKICGRQPLKNLKDSIKFFKGGLPQILLGPFLNFLYHCNTTRKIVVVI